MERFSYTMYLYILEQLSVSIRYFLGQVRLFGNIQD